MRLFRKSDRPAPETKNNRTLDIDIANDAAAPPHASVPDPSTSAADTPHTRPGDTPGPSALAAPSSKESPTGQVKGGQRSGKAPSTHRSSSPARHSESPPPGSPPPIPTTPPPARLLVPRHPNRLSTNTTSKDSDMLRASDAAAAAAGAASSAVVSTSPSVDEAASWRGPVAEAKSVQGDAAKLRPFLLAPRSGPTSSKSSGSQPPGPDDAHLVGSRAPRTQVSSKEADMTLFRPSTATGTTPSPSRGAQTDRFAAAALPDSEFVRLTYAWFERRGVSRDGASLGQEWTRERRKDMAGVWNSEKEAELAAPAIARPSVTIEQPEESIQPSLARANSRKSNRQKNKAAKPSSSRGPERPATASGPPPPLRPALSHRHTANTLSVEPATSNGPLGRLAAASSSARRLAADALEHLGGSTSSLNAPGRDESVSPSNLSHAPSHSTLPSESGSSSGSEEGESRARVEPPEAMAVEREIDRYGFFAGFRDAEACDRDRTVILLASAYQATPSRRMLRSTGYTGGAAEPKRGLLGRGRSDKRKNGTTAAAQVDGVGSGGDEVVEEDTEADRILAEIRSPRRITETLESRATKEAATQRKEEERVSKWAAMLSARDREREAGGNVRSYSLAPGLTRSSKKLRRRMYKGVPDRWRSAAWWAVLLAGVQDEHTEDRSRGAWGPAVVAGWKGGRHRRDQSVTDTIVDEEVKVAVSHAVRSVHHLSPHAAERRYPELVDIASTHDVQIDLDVPRTIPGHVLFHTRYGRGQRNLFHVLHAFSLLCSDCAYCQGMGPIAATLLQYLPPERAYAFLVTLHDCRLWNLHKTFSPGFPGLVENFYVQRDLVRCALPSVAWNLERHAVGSSSFATRWYITLFAHVVPFSTQLRLWDVMLLEGEDALVVFSLAILWGLRSALASRDLDFEAALRTLSAEFVPQDDDALLRWVQSVLARDDVRKRMARKRNEWNRLVEQGKADPASL